MNDRWEPLYADKSYEPGDIITGYPYKLEDIYERMWACMLGSSDRSKEAGRYPINALFFPYAFQNLGAVSYGGPPISPLGNLHGWYPLFYRDWGIPKDIEELSFWDNETCWTSDKCIIVWKITSKRVLGLLTLHANLRKVVEETWKIPDEVIQNLGLAHNRHQSPVFHLSQSIDSTLSEDMWVQTEVFDSSFFPGLLYALRGGRTGILRVTGEWLSALRQEIRMNYNFMNDHKRKLEPEAQEIHEGDLVLAQDPQGACESVHAILR